MSESDIKSQSSSWRPLANLFSVAVTHNFSCGVSRHLQRFYLNNIQSCILFVNDLPLPSTWTMDIGHRYHQLHLWRHLPTYLHRARKNRKLVFTFSQSRPRMHWTSSFAVRFPLLTRSVMFVSTRKIILIFQVFVMFLVVFFCSIAAGNKECDVCFNQDDDFYRLRVL